MRRIRLVEFGTFDRTDVEPAAALRLQRFDDQQAIRSGDTIFDWSKANRVRAKSYVGVVQVPGLAVEILPKVDDTEQANQFGLAQSNLLYMLAVTRRVPIHPRGLASQSIKKLPFLEALITIYLQRLLEELRRGRQHAYVNRQENLPCLKGKLLIAEHVQQNLVRRDRMFVSYDDFTDDTLLNQILKSATRRLLSISNLSSNQQQIREALIELADVEDREIQVSEIERLALDRGSQRYQDIVDFAKLILAQLAPTPTYGQIATFSLLFPMEKLFEEFIGETLRRHSGRFGLRREQIRLQAAGRKRWLLHEEGKGGRFRLVPDIVIDGDPGEIQLIVDTKWKRLVEDNQDSRNGVSQSDIYQLYAYSNRYTCPDSVLLYPATAGVTSKTYRLAGAHSHRLLRTAFIDVGKDLQAEHAHFLGELEGILKNAHATAHLG